MRKGYVQIHQIHDYALTQSNPQLTSHELIAHMYTSNHHKLILVLLWGANYWGIHTITLSVNITSRAGMKFEIYI